MKRVVWSIALLIIFMIFAISTTRIDKQIDQSRIPQEISSILSPEKIEQAVIFSDFKNGWYFFTTIFDFLVLGALLWLGCSKLIKSVSDKVVGWLFFQRYPILLSTSLFTVIALRFVFIAGTESKLVEAGSIVMAVLWGIVGVFVGRYRSYATKVIYILIFAGILSIIGLPLSYYRDFVVEHHFKLSNQSLLEWAASGLKSGLIGTLFMVLLVPFAYWGIGKRPKDWWLWIGVTAIPIMILVLIIVPVFVAPMFNKYEPLKDEALAQRILGMAEKAGISGGRVYQVDMSEETTKINAYVTGLFGSKRIVLWDNTINKMTPDEVAFVMAHEMGHYVLNHIWIGIALFSVIFLILLFIIHKSIGWFIHRFGDSFGFTSVSDIASLPLLMLMLSLLLFVLDPLTNGFSRKIERDADKFAMDITHDPVNGVGAFVKLANENLSNPQPSAFMEFWLFDHPPLKKRIDFCKSFMPEVNP